MSLNKPFCTSQALVQQLNESPRETLGSSAYDGLVQRLNEPHKKPWVRAHRHLCTFIATDHHCNVCNFHSEWYTGDRIMCICILLIECDNTTWKGSVHVRNKMSNIFNTCVCLRESPSLHTPYEIITQLRHGPWLYYQRFIQRFIQSLTVYWGDHNRIIT